MILNVIQLTEVEGKALLLCSTFSKNLITLIKCKLTGGEIYISKSKSGLFKMYCTKSFRKDNSDACHLIHAILTGQEGRV